MFLSHQAAFHISLSLLLIKKRKFVGSNSQIDLKGVFKGQSVCRNSAPFVFHKPNAASTRKSIVLREGGLDILN